MHSGKTSFGSQESEKCCQAPANRRPRHKFSLASSLLLRSNPRKVTLEARRNGKMAHGAVNLGETEGTILFRAAFQAFKMTEAGLLIQSTLMMLHICKLSSKLN